MQFVKKVEIRSTFSEAKKISVQTFFLLFQTFLFVRRRVKTFDESTSRPEVERQISKPLRRSIGEIQVTKSFAGWTGVSFIGFGGVWALLFFFDRSNVVAKGLSVAPALLPFILLLYKRAHLGVSPVAWLGGKSCSFSCF